MGDKDGPVLSFATIYFSPATFYLNVKEIFFEILYFGITDGGFATVIT